MNIRRQQIRLIERADPDDLGDGTGAGVVAPHRHAAPRTPRNLLPTATL